MKPLIAVIAALSLAGCATADVVRTQGGIHTLRVEGSRSYNRNHVYDAMSRQASSVCANGFDVLSQRDVGPWRAGNAFFQAHPAAYEWRIRCL